MSILSPLEVAQRFLDTLTRADIDNWSKLLSPDASMLFPYSPPGFPKRYEGRAECAAATRGILSAFESFEFYEVDLHRGEDPELVFGMARSRALTKTGKAYGNDYCLMFRVRNGQIVHYREYFNPLPIIATFGETPGAPAA